MASKTVRIVTLNDRLNSIIISETDRRKALIAVALAEHFINFIDSTVRARPAPPIDANTPDD